MEDEYMNKPEVQAERPLQLKDLEEGIKSILQSCWAMSSELETTEEIILHGQECSSECENKASLDKNVPKDRYHNMYEDINDIRSSLDRTRERIKKMRVFFEK